MYQYDMKLEAIIGDICRRGTECMSVIKALKSLKHNGEIDVIQDIAGLEDMIAGLADINQLNDIIREQSNRLNTEYCLPSVLLDSFSISSAFYGDRRADNLLQLICMSNDSAQSLKSIVTLWMKCNPSIDTQGAIFSELKALVDAIKDQPSMTPKHETADPFEGHERLHFLTQKFMNLMPDDLLEHTAKVLSDANASYESVLCQLKDHITLPFQLSGEPCFDIVCKVDAVTSLKLSGDKVSLITGAEEIDLHLQHEEGRFNDNLNKVIQKLDFLNPEYPSTRQATLSELREMSQQNLQNLHDPYRGMRARSSNFSYKA